MRIASALAGLLGGLAWIAALAVGRTGEASLVEPLTWGGLLLVGVAALAVGSSLVSRSTPWLKVVVSVCFATLAGSVLAVLHDAGDDRAVDAAVGLAAVIVAVVVLARRRPAPVVAPSRHAARSAGGSHAR